MKISFYPITKPFENNPSIKLKMMNTFFALTLASYCVAAHPPKAFRWNLGYKLYGTTSETAVKSEVSLNISLPSLIPWVHSTFVRQDLSPLLERVQISPLTREVFSTLRLSQQDFLGLKESGSHVPFTRFSAKINITPTPLDWIPGPSPQEPLLLPKGGYLAENDFLEESIYHTHISQSYLRVFRGLENQVLEENENITKTASLTLPESNIFKGLENQALKGDKSIAKSEPLPVPESNLLPSWYTYKIDSKDQQLIYWLMKLAPGPKTLIPQKEIPFRKGLIKTLLSPEFQPYINTDWVDEDTLEMKEMREDFFYRYMKNVEWSETDFGHLFPEQGPEDFHLVDPETFAYAYDLPRRLGVYVYEDEDIYVH